MEARDRMTWTWSIPVLGPLLYLAAAVVAFQALRRARTPQGAVGWTVFLFAWPVIAVPLYLVFGYARIQSYSEARRRIEAQMPDGSDAALAAAPEAEARLAALRAVANCRVMRGNGMSLLPQADAAFDAMIEAIDRAERYVLVEFYTIRSDRIGTRFGEALIRAAGRGVKVRVLHDAFGTFRVGRRIVAAMARAGIETRVQRGPARPLGRLGLNFRNHRKILVVDGHLAFTGGMNIGDEYLGAWRDTQIALTGPIVQQFQAQVLQDWYWVSGERIDAALDWCARADRADMAGFALGASPTDPQDTGVLYFAALAATAQRRLWIATPYFAPEQGVLAALVLAALRGVEVRLLTPEVPDRWTPWIAAHAFFDEVRTAGVEIWRYEGEFMHQKVALVDDDVVSVGTFNLDVRSCLLNFETTAILCDPRAARAVEAMLARDFAQARRLDRPLDDAPLWLRASAPVARLLAPLL